VFVHKFDGADCLEATLEYEHAEYAKNFEGIALLGAAGLHEGSCSNQGFSVEVPGADSAMVVPFTSIPLTFTRMKKSTWDAAKLKAQSFIAAPFLGTKKSEKFLTATPAVVTDAEEDGKVDVSAQSRRKVFKDAAAAALAGSVALSNPLSANAITSDIRNQLSYEQVKGTGLANRCNEVQGKDSIKIGSGNYQLTSFCLEPKTWQVEEEVANKKGDVTKQFVNTKLMTRQTYTLDGISGSLSTSGGGITFKEEDGIDYAPTTVQLPGGERVPFLFTVKKLLAKGQGDTFKPGLELSGTFEVPSYRTGLFLDPKGRGMTTGYDQAGALPASQTGTDAQGELEKENNKVFDVFDGTIELAVSQVNAELGEIGGVFVSSQASDTDLGSKVPKKVLSKGIWYAQVEKVD